MLCDRHVSERDARASFGRILHVTVECLHPPPPRAAFSAALDSRADLTSGASVGSGSHDCMKGCYVAVSNSNVRHIIEPAYIQKIIGTRSLVRLNFEREVEKILENGRKNGFVFDLWSAELGNQIQCS